MAGTGFGKGGPLDEEVLRLASNEGKGDAEIAGTVGRSGEGDDDSSI